MHPGSSCNNPTATYDFVYPQEYSVIDGYGSPVITIEPTVLSATIQNLDLRYTDRTLDNSVATGIHGVISNSAKILLDKVVVKNGNAIRGGMYLEVRGGSRLVMSNMQITGNSADEGGGFEIHVLDNSQVIIQGSQIATLQ